MSQSGVVRLPRANRVIWHLPRSSEPTCSAGCLGDDLANWWLAGPGRCSSLLLLHPGIEQETPHEPMRFIDVGGELTLQAKCVPSIPSTDHRYFALTGDESREAV